MIIKVCGMRQPENIRQVAALGVDWIGFIFYPSSKRYVEQLGAEAAHEAAAAARSSRSVGVFVNSTVDEMTEKAAEYGLDYLQLHGHESPQLCYGIRKRGNLIIKALSIATGEDLKRAAEYEGQVDYFLFDTKCEGYGGSGKSFDWSLLAAYKGETPFLLSGGLRPESLEALRNFHHPRLAGLDLNSGFETEAGLKDPEKLKEFITQLRRRHE